MENRIIKFKAKRQDNGEWIEGFYYAQNIRNGFSQENEVLFVSHFIRPIDPIGLFEAIEVIPETVSQFTGLFDKNGKEIYEGDRLMVQGTKRKGLYETVILWKGNGFYLENNQTYFTTFPGRNGMEVIGNIFEPEIINN